jgi:hypothetical protein
MQVSEISCAECECPEHKHLYSGPSYFSDDGLPTFEGCNGKGSKVKDDGWTVVYRCGCRDFVDPDDVDTEVDELDYFNPVTGESGLPPDW